MSVLTFCLNQGLSVSFKMAGHRLANAGFDDEELSMSLSSPVERRGTTKPSAASQARAPAQQQSTHQSHELPSEGRAGQRIGQYSIKRTLGEGSFGKVKLAVHRVSGQEVALKIISRKKLISRDMAGRVEREIQYLQLLRHPHIIKLCVNNSKHVHDQSNH